MDGLVIRHLHDGEAEAFGDLVARAREAGELAASADSHGDFLVRLAVRAPLEAAVAELGGSLVGFVAPDPKVVWVEPGLRRRGIGRRLVEAGAIAARGLGYPALVIGVLPGDEAGRAFLGATGFAYHSTLWDLELGPGVPVPPPSWPDGIRARPIDGARDLPAWVELFNAAFAGHATPMQARLADIEADWGRPMPASDEDVLVLEDAGGRLVGFCSSEPGRLPDGTGAPRAEIWTIGVRPDAQGRGLGRQLLRWGVGYLRGLGVGTVALSVNGINARALGLYEAEGFVRSATRERWALPVPLEPPVPSAPPAAPA